MGWVRAIAALAVAAAVAGCSSVPSYYSERVSGKASAGYAAMGPAVADPEPAAPKRRTAKRSRASQTAARRSDAISTASAGASQPTREADAETSTLPGAELEAKRERALKRKLNSICQGC